MTSSPTSRAIAPKTDRPSVQRNQIRRKDWKEIEASSRPWECITCLPFEVKRTRRLIPGWSTAAESSGYLLASSIRIPCALLDTEISGGDLPSLLRPQDGSVPADHGPLERYEVRDIDTNDVLVMWRIPYRFDDGDGEGD